MLSLPRSVLLGLLTTFMLSAAAGASVLDTTSMWDDVKNTTECHIRLLAYEYGLQTIPYRSPQLESFDALELTSMCDVPRPAKRKVSSPTWEIPASPAVFYVDNSGNARGNGTESSPFQTVHEAVAAARKSPYPDNTIVLRSGIHFFNATLVLGPDDNGLTITNYPKEEAWISGGIPLSTKWTPYNTTGANIYVTDITLPAGTETILGLMTESPHKRLTRARFPNANPEDRFTVKNLGGDNIVEWVPPKKLPAAEQVFINATETANFDSSILYQYNAYANGKCKKVHDPECPCAAWSDVREGVWTSESYWCSNQSAGGWSEMDRGNGYYNGPILPTSLLYNKTLLPNFDKYADATGGILFAWRAQGWFNNMYEIAEHDKEQGSLSWTKGGFQGGRGWQLNGTTGAIDPNPPFFVENIFEELDNPEEWFYDRDTKKLYLWYNGTGAPPADLKFISTNLKHLVELRGSQKAPVVGVTIQGLGFRDTAYTYMEPWGVPSGGDWALYRGGAVMLEGTENCLIQHNLWKRVDGNGLFLSGYNRNTSIFDNEFVWIGDCAMAGWGYTDEQDGTGGDQPRFTNIQRNYAHELGIFQLQSSMWFQAKSAQNNISSNIFFNGPRSGINFNDGFGGGTVVSKNLIYNQCRQSGDHGPINSWDRQLYWTDVRDGPSKPGYNPAFNEIAQNFIIANYGGSQGVDNDDGSSWYDIHDNFFYGEGLKQDYGGHDSKFHGNVVVVHKYDGQNCINTWPFQSGPGPCVDNITLGADEGDCSHSHQYVDNKCVILYTEQYGSVGAYGSTTQHTPHLVNNKYYTPLGNASLSTSGTMRPLKELQEHNVEMGSTAGVVPSDTVILEWAREKLDMPPPA